MTQKNDEKTNTGEGNKTFQGGRKKRGGQEIFRATRPGGWTVDKKLSVKKEKNGLKKTFVDRGMIHRVYL